MSLLEYVGLVYGLLRIFYICLVCLHFSCLFTFGQLFVYIYQLFVYILNFVYRLLCRRLSILPEEGEDCLSNSSSNDNWNFVASANQNRNSFRRTHSEEKDSYSISQQSVHQHYNKNKFSSKSMDRIAGVVTTSSDSSPSARSTSR